MYITGLVFVHQGERTVSRKAHNQFRDPTKRKDFERLVAMYEEQHKAIFARVNGDGVVVGRAGNSWASAFWAGYDGMTTGIRVPTPDLHTYVWYRAGQAVRAREQAS